MESNNELAIAPDYDSTEFAPLRLLEKGDVDVWVRRRGAILIEKSKETAKECEAGKLASAITVGASVIMSANPLAWLPMTVGALGYVYTVFQEFQDTGSIRLIPMYRGKLGDILKVMEGGQVEQRHPLQDQIEYLSEAEKDEVLLINYRFSEIAGVLNAAPPKVRFDLYRHLCGQFHSRRDLISGDEVQNYVNTAVSQERRAMPPQAEATPFLLPRPEYKLPESQQIRTTMPQQISRSQSFTENIEFKEEVPNLPLKLAQDMKNTLIAGVPGSGKGLFISNALGYVAERGDTTVFYVDPKNDPKESGYYQGRVHRLFQLPGGIIAADPVFVYNWLQKCFTNFHSFDAGNGRKLLVLDEMTSLVKKLANVPAKITGTVKGDKWLEEEIVTCAAAGDSAGATLWGMAQNGHNSGLGMDGGAKSQMTPIAIISLKQLTASQALLKASFVPSDQRLNSDEIKRICEASEVGRAIFHGGLNRWYSMPALPNPSGYNRDNRQFMEGFSSATETISDSPVALPVTTPSPLPDVRQEYSDEEQQQAVDSMVAALRSTMHTTLWEFARDELGLESSEEIKAVLSKIADVIFDYDLAELKQKFRLQNKSDVRYSYAGYSKKVAQAHRATNNICCCCLQNPSEEFHHSRYQGINDRVGVNGYPVCGGRGKNGCHDQLCHSFENWIVDKEDLWGSHNTPEWESKLKEGFERLATNNRRQES